MAVAWAETLLNVVALYLAAGAVFAVVFLAFGLRRLDPIAAAGPLRFKLLIAPGVVAIWPVMIALWAAGRRNDA
jgi:hypothetical protein